MVFLAKEFCKGAEEEMGERLRAGIDGGSQLLSLQWCSMTIGYVKETMKTWSLLHVADSSDGGVLYQWKDPVIIQAGY